MYFGEVRVSFVLCCCVFSARAPLFYFIECNFAEANENFSSIFVMEMAFLSVCSYLSHSHFVETIEIKKQNGKKSN